MSKVELDLLGKVHQEMVIASDYLNEEEIKIRLIAPLLQLADLDEGDQIRVFFERSLSAELEGYQLSVVCDCMVAASTIFKTPIHPYFFLQEFKKAKGEKHDPKHKCWLRCLRPKKPMPTGNPFMVVFNWPSLALGRIDRESVLYQQAVFCQ